MSIATPAFFSCPFTWNIHFQPFTFSLCKSFVLRWVSCRQHTCGSCFLIHSTIPCLSLGHLIHLHLRLLLIGTYSFSFFHICVPLSFTIFLLVLKVDPLASVAELVWRRYILWGFFCLGNSLFGLLSWLRAMLGKVVLVAGLWFSLLGIFLAISFWLGAFPLRIQLLVLLGLPCMLLPVFPLQPLRFSLYLGVLPF